MKIVIDARIIASSTGRYVERLLTYLEKIDHENEYVALIRPQDTSIWQPTQPNFSIVTTEAADFSLAEQTTLKRQIKLLKPDLVHFCMPQQPILYHGNKVTTIHDLSQLRVYNPAKNWFVYRFKQLVGWFVFKIIIRTNTHLITDSNYSKQDIEAFSSAAKNKTTTVYLSADKLGVGVSAEAEYQLPSEKFILYVGQLSPHKNVKRLIQAHQELLTARPDLLLVIVGRLSPVALATKTWAQHNNYKNIIFTGFVPDAQLAWLYEHALCYGFSSLMEGFGLPGLEAMYHGTPVVSSNATCSPEIFGDAAVYFDPRNVTDMSEKLALVIDNPKKQAELRARGYKQLKKYSWEKMARETHSIYMDALR